MDNVDKFKKFPEISSKTDAEACAKVSHWEIAEKIDGSNFRYEVDPMRLGSRRRVIDLEANPNSNFGPITRAMKENPENVQALALWMSNYINFGEAMRGAKANVIKYDRCPSDGMVWYNVFDKVNGMWLFGEAKYKMLKALAQMFGEYVPCDAVLDHFPSPEELEGYLNLPSMLGGRREGVVLKPYDADTRDRFGNPLFIKVVNADFKERMGAKKTKMPKDPNADPIVDLINEFLTDMRFQKAIQRLEDEGRWKGSREDFFGSESMVGPLIGELSRDILKEHSVEITELAVKLAKKKMGSVIPAFVREKILSK